MPPFMNIACKVGRRLVSHLVESLDPVLDGVVGVVKVGPLHQALLQDLVGAGEERRVLEVRQ